MTAFAVLAIGDDRPGIVAAVTGVLVREGCNLEDTAMSILRGQFAMVMVVDAPDGVDGGRLRGAIADSSPDIYVTVRSLHDTHAAPDPTRVWTVTVHGADRPGIVHAFAAALAELHVNILDLSTRVAEGTTPLYSMLIDVALPADLDASALQVRLDAVAAEVGVVCSLHYADADVL